MMFKFIGILKRRHNEQCAITADTESLMTAHGRDAYAEARKRERATADREARHWASVAIEIARRLGHPVGLDTATRMADRK
jgi:hypothetical protein